jgi:hypothetical protein
MMPSWGWYGIVSALHGGVFRVFPETIKDISALQVFFQR